MRLAQSTRSSRADNAQRQADSEDTAPTQAPLASTGTTAMREQRHLGQSHSNDAAATPVQNGQRFQRDGQQSVAGALQAAVEKQSHQTFQ